MKSKIIILIIISLVITSIVLTNCRKSEENSNFNTDIVKDNSFADDSYSDALTICDQIVSNNSSDFKNTENITSQCISYTLDLLSVPHTLIVDFGDTNCMCTDLKLRRGEIIASFNGAYRDSGTVINISFYNYYVNDNQILGTKTITNMGTNSEQHLYYQIAVSGAIVKPAGDTITWNSNRTRTWIEGSETQLWSDDVYLIEGTAYGYKSNGYEYDVTITIPLRREIDCSHLVSGELTIEQPTKPLITINFGDGNCDSAIVITYNNNTIYYSL